MRRGGRSCSGTLLSVRPAGHAPGRRDCETSPGALEAWWHDAEPLRSVYPRVMRCFYPLVRLSARAVHSWGVKRKRASAIQRGVPAGERMTWPNDEIFTATVLADAGLPCADFNELGHFYTFDLFGSAPMRHRGQLPADDGRWSRRSISARWARSTRSWARTRSTRSRWRCWAGRWRGTAPARGRGVRDRSLAAADWRRVGALAPRFCAAVSRPREAATLCSIQPQRLPSILTIIDLV